MKAFDTVLEQFAENNRTAEAMYMKGMSLLKSGQRTQAGQEFLNVIQKYPNSGVRPMRKSSARRWASASPAARQRNPPGAAAVNARPSLLCPRAFASRRRRFRAS